MTGIQKVSSIVFTIIAGLSLIFAGMYYLGGSVPETIGTGFEAKIHTGLVLVWAVILFIVATAATLIFSFSGVFTSPKAIKGFLITLVVGAVLLGICYLLASSDPINIASLEKIPTPSTIKWVGVGLNATYILAVAAFVGIIATEVIRAFK